MLKRLRGTPIIRHDSAEQIIYSPATTYEVLSTRVLCAADLGRLRRFTRVWDLLGNNDNFVETLLWRDESPFWTLWRLTDWLYARLGLNVSEIAPTLLRDYQRDRRSDLPVSLRDVSSAPQSTGHPESMPSVKTPPHQSRHVAQAPRS